MLRLGEVYRPADLLPQRPPMLLLDRIDDYGDDWLRSSVVIGPQCRFFQEPNGVPSYVGLEYMAQTAAAHAGVEIVQRGERPGIALLLGCREYVARQPHFAVGAELQIEARLVIRDQSDFVAYDCRILNGALSLAEATLKAFRPSNMQAVLQSQIDDR